MSATAPQGGVAAHPAHHLNRTVIVAACAAVVLVIAGAAMALTYRFHQAQQAQPADTDVDAATAPSGPFKSQAIPPRPGETMQQSRSGSSGNSRASIEPTRRPPASRAPTHRDTTADNGDAQIATIRAVVANSLSAGTACYDARQFDCAVTNAEAALRLDPYNARAQSLRARAKAAQQAALNHLPIE